MPFEVQPPHSPTKSTKGLVSCINSSVYLCRHCTSDRGVPNCSATIRQLRAPWCSTISRRRVSCRVQRKQPLDALTTNVRRSVDCPVHETEVIKAKRTKSGVHRCHHTIARLAANAKYTFGLSDIFCMIPAGTDSTKSSQPLIHSHDEHVCVGDKTIKKTQFSQRRHMGVTGVSQQRTSSFVHFPPFGPLLRAPLAPAALLFSTKLVSHSYVYTVE